MSIVIVGLAIGSTIPLPEAADITKAAADAGVTAIRVQDGAPGRTLDASVVASYLAGTKTAPGPGPGWILEASTNGNAPTNLARRANSLDRATGGRAALALRAGDGDEVSDPVAPRPGGDRSARWDEYARILKGLWTSFPAAALVGDQDGEVFAEHTLIRPIDFEGDYYRVAGPLDGPASPQGGPLLVADDPDILGWDVVARSADVVVVDPEAAPTAGADLSAALARAGRPRQDVALLVRVDAAGPRAVTADLSAFVAEHELDGVEFTPAGGKDDVLALITGVVPTLAPSTGETLRGAFSLPHPA
ncbi:putative monooxygenase [Actinacidiphila reveromycinica]|uniref:Putative monooxygenase n=1 Tax=Actinacidiphila reveromycinica TaxID=659352 RepID=A0A7U3VSL2_9ACTN|nr:LLM class flavin-dependent oxidoreductase [Streptomyces sp. SN-593]BBB02043.1 putative monooxygenase [Streptomyces sp. SN-593]